MSNNSKLMAEFVDAMEATNIELVASDALTDRHKVDLLELARTSATQGHGNVFDSVGAVKASEAFGSQTVLWLMQFAEGCLCFAAPIVTARTPFGSVARIWTHDFAPLGTPLIGQSFDALQLLSSLHDAGHSALVVPYLNMKSMFAQQLVGAASTNFSSAVHTRACLDGDWRAEDVFSKKRMKEMRRLERKQPLEHVVLRKDDAAGVGFDAFCRLEALSWKGSGGTAMQQDANALAYANALIADHCVQDSLAVDCLKDGEKIVAALISFVQHGRGVIWKIAHDPAYDVVSPGRQVILAATQRLMDTYPELHIDSLATPDHPLINRLWPKQVPMANLIVPTGSSTLLASTLSLRYNGEEWARQQARSLRAKLRA
ncbi:MAG: GNAT family N-acetyltransferase [Rhizobiales bacterium]|nr:GNAT family N-acetyltransferase [Hyphomicrobiales bacterium]